MQLVGFIIEIYHDARPHERQMHVQHIKHYIFLNPPTCCCPIAPSSGVIVRITSVYV